MSEPRSPGTRIALVAPPLAALAVAAALAPASCAESERDRTGVSSPLAAAVQNGLVKTGRASAAGGQPDTGLTTLSESMAHYGVPAVSIAAMDSDGIAWTGAWGVQDARTRAPATTETMFEAASVSKMVVAAIVLRLVEQGRLDPDADVNGYLRSWRVPDNRFTRAHPVTLRLLLSHRSGLPTTNFPYDDGTRPTLVQVLQGAPPARNAAAVVQSEPGSEWRYSNLGYVLVQLVLEDVTGKPLQQVADEEVFRPLGMASSTFRYPLPPELSGREALPHDSAGVPHTGDLHPTAQAQGGLLTTPSDIARLAIELMKAYRGESERLFSQATARLMFSPEADLAPAIFGGVPMKDALGVFLRMQGDTFSVSHAGFNTPGSTFWVSAFPQTGQGAVIATNAAGGLPGLTLEVLGGFATAYRWPLPW